MKNYIVIYSKKRETRDRDGTEKQWTEIETETKTVDNDMTKKNGEERSLSTTTTSSVDESLPKVNPVKWTVIKYFNIVTYIYVRAKKISLTHAIKLCIFV